MQTQQFMRQHNRYSRSMALLLTLLLGLGLIQPAQAQAVTPGYVQGWGLDHLGQLPVPPDLSDVIAVAASQVHSLALKSNGEVVAWGSNIDGQTDVPASAMSSVIAIAAGGDHSMALKSDGTVVAWGSNASNQLDIPAGLNNVIAIAAGDFHSLALKSNGEVVAWGCGGGYDYGQCTVPSAALSGVTAIGAGAAHSLALKNGGVIAWGIDLQGQIAVPASATSGVVAIAAAGGSNHSLALKSNGAIVAWGRNEDGQTDVPAGLSGVVAIATGFNHSMALKSDGTLAAWGNNSYGQTDVPAGLTGIVGMAGGWHTLVIVPPPSVTINQAAGQADPTATTPILFTATFSKPVTDFTAVDVSLSGTADLTNATITISGGPSSYTSSVDGVDGGGTVIATIPANGAIDANGYGNRASTSTDNSVTLTVVSNPPTITPNIVGTLGNNGWYVSNVTVSWTVVANGAAISSQSGCETQNITSDTSGITFTCSATNAAGSSSESVTIQRDATAPTISAAATSNPNVAGWYNSNVTVHFTCADDLSGVRSCPADQVLSNEGATVASTAPTITDQAGNSSAPSNVVTVKIDKSAPTVNAAATTQPNANGWYKNDVTIHFTCADSLSGVTSCPADEVLSSEGDAVASTAQMITDLAGNSSTSNVVTVKIDKTAPTISATVTTAPNAAGWYTSNVAVRFTCTDALSGAANCPADQLLNSEGSAVSSTAQTVTDQAGNSSAASNVVTVKIDKTVPTIVARTTTSSNPNGWFNYDVTVRFSCADNLSGVTSCPADQILSNEGSSVASTAQTITDLAGNSSAPSNVVTVRIDKTAPTISAAATSAPNANGWYNGNVTIRFTCTDPLSGVVSCPADQVLSSEGAAIASTAQAVTDRAGNASVASNVVTVKIDKTAPVVTLTGVTNGAIYPADSPPTPSCTTSDALSGVATQATVKVSGGNPLGTGTFLVSCRGATDNAGNSSSASTFYRVPLTPGTVVGWGLQSPPAGLNQVVAVAGGRRHSLALKSDGTVVAWGDDSSGQSSVPSGLSNVIAIAANQTHSLAAKSDGTVVAWGCRQATFDLGQCQVPTGLNNVIAVAAGAFHSLALRSDGTVVAWGASTQFGANVVPGGLRDVIAIATGDFQNMALKDDGTVVTWGITIIGHSPTPPGLNNVVAIAAGGSQRLALKSDGTVVGWGSRGAPNLQNVVAIAAGDQHGLALKSDGTVVAWGDNTYGQLNVPAGLGGGVGIGAGFGHNLVITVGPSVTINQAAGQADPASSNPVRFDVVFSAAVTGFTAEDVLLSGTADRTNASVSLSGGPSSYTVSVDGLAGSGTMIATIAAKVATDADGYGNHPSSSTDNVVTVNLDSTPPVITPTVAGTLGSNDWYTSDVNVTWSVVDTESAISNQSGCTAVTVNADTSGNTITCTATSGGGSSSQNVTIKRDATASTITFVDRTAANPNGWNNSAVTVNWSCSDATSGVVAASVNQTVSSEGANQSATGACTDNAGNSASDTQNGINIDQTAPTISAVATTDPNAAGWYNSDVTVHFACADSLSGVTSCPIDETLSSEGSAVASTAQTITDLAGNSSDASNVVTVKIDKTAPTINAAATTQPNANGWYKSDVTVRFTCADALSGVTSCPVDQVLSSEGAAVASTAQTISDLAGNSSAASNVVTVQIDKTAPVVTVTGMSNNASYTLGSVPAAGCSTTDALSGVATQATLSVTGGNADGTGSFTATCSGATDNAGNNGSASVTYRVAYNWTGFFQPVDNLPVVNTVNAGQAIPVKFSLGGNYGLNIFASGYPASQQVSCGGGDGGSTSPIEETVTAGNSSLQYDPGTQRYIYVWKTDKAWAGTCRQLIVRLIDGTDHIALFSFNRTGRSADGSETEGETIEGESETARQQLFLPLVSNQ